MQVFKKNDKLLAINKKVVYSFKDFYLEIQKLKDPTIPIPITVIRGGKELTFNLSRKKTVTKDQIGNQETHYYIGVGSYGAITKPFLDTQITEGFSNITSKAYNRTVELSKFMIIGLGKLITGQISTNKISGPLMIGKIAGDSLSLGLIFFINLMALISLNLAFINLIPFPALDGGHILIMAIESLTRRKVPAKIIGPISYIGFFLLISLMVAISFNDVRKLFF